jgi:sialate O-acetylesterase
MKKLYCLVMAGGLLLLLAAAAFSNVTMNKMFATNMVLQHGVSVPIWGTANAGENVTVQFNGQNKSVTTGTNGAWRVVLDSMAISSTALQMTIRGANTVTLTNVLIGEVWLASGQSNISFPMSTIGGPNVDSANAANYPNLRFMNFREVGNWQVCTPTTALSFSPLAYYFGRNVHVNLNVPVGMILSALDGTDIERWMDSASIAADPLIATDPLAGNLYRPYIAPIAPYAIRGVIWYQGENNANEPYPNHPNWSASHYQGRFQALIQGWRRVWGQGDFPFYYVQLCSVNGLQTNPVGPTDTWAMIREAQRQSLSVPNTGMAVIIDLGENATVGTAELHPWNKWEVGKRLWYIASALSYGNASTVYSGPMYKSMAIRGNKINLHFTHTNGGLVARGGGSLRGFAIAGSNNNWVWGTATIDHDTVSVTSTQVAAPTQVLYACAHYPIFNLYNGAGLPASPFMTRPSDIVAVAQSPAMPTGVGAMSGITSVKVFDVTGRCLGTITNKNARAFSAGDVARNLLSGQGRIAKGIYIMQIISVDKAVIAKKIAKY